MQDENEVVTTPEVEATEETTAEEKATEETSSEEAAA